MKKIRLSTFDIVVTFMLATFSTFPSCMSSSVAMVGTRQGMLICTILCRRFAPSSFADSNRVVSMEVRVA